MTEIKYPKWLKIISISIIIIGIFVISFIKYWPTYQKKIGLNYLDFNYNDYKTMIEIELSNGYDFAFIINKENKVSNVFFFNQESVILSNYDLSKKTISKDIKVIIDNLNENNNLDNIIIKIIDYNNTTLKADIEKELINNLSKKTSTYQILSEEKTLLTKAQELNITKTEEKEILLYMNLYSVNLITNYNNGTNILDNNKQPNINKIKEYSDSIYKKLEKYKENNSVVNQDIDDSKFPIQLIPSSTDNYYADSDSWYYIKDSNIYAYIKLTIGKETYEYCYKGSIDNYQFGKC